MLSDSKDMGPIRVHIQRKYLTQLQSNSRNHPNGLNGDPFVFRALLITMNCWQNSEIYGCMVVLVQVLGGVCVWPTIS